MTEIIQVLSIVALAMTIVILFSILRLVILKQSNQNMTTTSTIQESTTDHSAHTFQENAEAPVVAPVVNDGDGIKFGGDPISERQEKESQLTAEAKAKKEKEEQEVIAAMENNINKWGVALTETIKEIMKGGENK